MTETETEETTETETTKSEGSAAKKQPEAKPEAQKERSTSEVTDVRAKARYVRVSARKARLVADHVRGKSVVEARAVLAHLARAAAKDWSGVLESAVANAEENHGLDADELRIKEIFADEGPTLKRFRPRAMGRATKILKRTSHLTVVLTTQGKDR